MGTILKSLKLTDDELEKINTYTRREFTADEVYTFSLVLCDNDVDRDFERFTVESLFQLEKLFVGKTGIFDHNPKAENQSARIYDCKVEAVESKKTDLGDDYFRLTAKAYIPKSDKTEDMILLIESGILKEVSIGCSVGDKVCSICGKEAGDCQHIKGNEYGGELCVHLLTNPTDAYEWSFVAVPAQKQAGVIKNMKNYKEKFMTKENTKELLKAFNSNKEKAFDMLKNAQELCFDKEDCKSLLAFIKAMEKDAFFGRQYKADLCKSFIKLSAIVQPEISADTTKNIAEKLSVEQLKEFISVYEKKAQDVLPVRPQLFTDNKNQLNNNNKAFEI